MENEHQQRLDALRQRMRQHGISAAIVPQADPHMGEYLASHWQARRWLSGFTGSAGDLAVTADAAALWTDSRYFLQAAEQLAPTGIELMKDGLADTPTMAQWLGEHLKAGQFVGFDGMLFTMPQVQALADELGRKGILINSAFDPVENIWPDRPALPDGPVYVHPLEYAGENARGKIAAVIAEAKSHDTDAVLMSALDDIAWTLNIRSNDVRHTPVVTAFLFVTPAVATLFVDPVKISGDVEAYLHGEGVAIRPYGDIKNFLASLPAATRVAVDAAHTAAAIMNILGTRAADTGLSAAARLKSIKNDTQLAGVRRAMVRDGVALVKAFMEIERRMAEGTPTTEMDVADILRHYRSMGKNYMDESFGTIAGYGPHGAIVHYEADEAGNATLRSEGLLLIDSGAQYLDGTTDITRTISLGAPTADEKRDFTLVMKGHIALAQAVFPLGSRGAQLDILARQFLWHNGLNYLHGTGHGVGHFLSVHEGPHSIRLNNVEAPILPGAITSNEPGLYRAGIHGIRCENLVLCVPAMRTEFGQFLKFETLTLFPFDLSLFDPGIMTDSERQWLNGYHDMVSERLMPHLDSEESRQWLAEHTKHI